MHTPEMVVKGRPILSKDQVRSLIPAPAFLRTAENTGMSHEQCLGIVPSALRSIFLVSPKNMDLMQGQYSMGRNTVPIPNRMSIPSMWPYYP